VTGPHHPDPFAHDPERLRFKVKRITVKLGNVALDKLDEGLDPSSVHHLHRVLSAALRQAVKWGLLSSAVTARASPAPIFACYGNNKRTNMLRIPLGGGRVECRAADSSTNLYLGAALMLAAGLEAIREGLDPGEPNLENIYLLSEEELAARVIRWLPRTLLESVEALDADLTRQGRARARHAHLIRVDEDGRVGQLPHGGL
jgi:hypothetical protein